MKTKKSMASLPVLISLLSSFPAHATLNVSALFGEIVIQHEVPGARPEVCVVPKHLTINGIEVGEYKKKDVETELELCSLNVYSNTAVCPKLNSTNPGLRFHKVPKGMTIEQVENGKDSEGKSCYVPDPAKIDKDTKKPKNKADMLAKYKLSTSCSYTPSILGYYQMSRILGRIANVPVAVLRTFDLKRHVSIGDDALDITKDGSTINLTWDSLKKNLDNPENSKKKDLLFTSTLDQSYGALVKNPKGEAFYKEFFSGGKEKIERATKFRDENPIVAGLAKTGSVTSFIGRDFNAANAQKMQQLKDASDLIIMDTLLSQEDRFGNIHFETKNYYIDASSLNKAGYPKIKTLSDKEKEELTSPIQTVPVMEMVLKDNDCGVARENVAKKVGLAAKIAHLDPETYTRLLQLDAAADKAEVRSYFTNELLFTDSDYKTMRANLKELASSLKAKCQKGQLKLDLDLAAHFSGKTIVEPSCEVAPL